MAKVDFRVRRQGAWDLLEGVVDGKRASCRMPHYLVETMKEGELAEQLETAKAYDDEQHQSQHR